VSLSNGNRDTNDVTAIMEGGQLAAALSAHQWANAVNLIRRVVFYLNAGGFPSGMSLAVRWRPLVWSDSVRTLSVGSAGSP
jgi:hypothetical protein